MRKIKLLFISLSLGLLFIFLLATNIAAQTKSVSPTPTPEQSSYVFFYPVVAGKTEGDKLYTLKLIRDRLVALFAFGDEKKSEANLKIATKRLLETEKLFKTNKAHLAQKTLSKFTTKLAAAYDYTMKAEKAESFSELLNQISQNTPKYQIVLKQILAISPENEKDLVEESIKRVAEIQTKVDQQLKAE